MMLKEGISKVEEYVSENYEKVKETVKKGAAVGTVVAMLATPVSALGYNNDTSNKKLDEPSWEVERYAENQVNNGEETLFEGTHYMLKRQEVMQENGDKGFTVEDTINYFERQASNSNHFSAKADEESKRKIAEDLNNILTYLSDFEYGNKDGKSQHNEYVNFQKDMQSNKVYKGIQKFIDENKGGDGERECQKGLETYAKREIEDPLDRKVFKTVVDIIQHAENNPVYNSQEKILRKEGYRTKLMKVADDTWKFPADRNDGVVTPKEMEYLAGRIEDISGNVRDWFGNRNGEDDDRNVDVNNIGTDVLNQYLNGNGY